uniref:Uncharacterized protein n=1 Tax=Aquisalinus luteolus TaxID=1566827 RepID=A0A8J3A8Y2_9PROT|nr:hypothetical protein GCM10011355_25040 [Aquisalinus luteolus]
MAAGAMAGRRDRRSMAPVRGTRSARAGRRVNGWHAEPLLRAIPEPLMPVSRRVRGNSPTFAYKRYLVPRTVSLPAIPPDRQVAELVVLANKKARQFAGLLSGIVSCLTPPRPFPRRG